MIIRNGIRSNLRAKGRTALFTALILALTLCLSLGLGLWAYCARMLAQCDETYLSTALIEYMGSDYPDADAADEYARTAAQALNDSAIAAVDGVQLWERTDQTLAGLEGYSRSASTLSNGGMAVMVVDFISTPVYETQLVAVPEEELPLDYVTYDMDTGVSIIHRSGGDLPAYLLANGVCYAQEDVLVGYRASVRQVLYARDCAPGNFVYIDLSDSGFVPEAGKHYLIHAAAFDSIYSNRSYSITEFYEGCDTLPYLAVEDGDPALTGGIFAAYAQRYQLAANYVRLTASADISSLDEFQQGALYLSQGRFPDAGEAGVCVISGYTAAQLGLEPGDTVTITPLDSDPADRFVLTSSGEGRILTVAGITNANGDYEGWLWVSDAGGGFGQSLYGYQLGRVVLDNAKARAAVETLEAIVPSQVRITLYDQGYAAAAQPLQTMRTTALAITLASAAGALAVLALFAYLFVGRQRETVDLLVSLGVPKHQITLWLLSGAAVISGAAAALGGLAGGALLGRVIRLALDSAQALYAADQRYSESLVGLQKGLAYSAAAPLWPAVAAALGVFLVGLVLCALFLRQARRQNAPTRGKLRTRTPRGGTSVSGRGVLRFALRNAQRGGARSCAVPAAALVLALFIGLLGSTAQGWEAQLDRLYEDSAIEGQVVSLNGRTYTNLTIPAASARSLWNSGLLSELDTAVGWNYWLEDEIPSFGSSSFGEESKNAWIAQQPYLCALNSLSAAAEFYYADAAVEWLEGWDESCLASGEYSPFYYSFFPDSSGAAAQETYPVAASRAFLESHGLSLGDTFCVTFRSTFLSGWGSATTDTPVNLIAVGSFSQQSPKANLYVPLAFYFDPDWLTGEEDVITGTQRPSTFKTLDELNDSVKLYTNFTACRFTLASAYDLEALRDYLAAQNFSQVGLAGSNRTAILLRDAAFTETVGSLGRYISFGGLLLPILLTVVGVMGFILSWLMINSRRMEFAVMRGLGAPKGKVFLTFFLEQALLCLSGTAIACLLLALIPGGGALQWLAVGGFCLCYLAGCTLCVLAVGRTNLMNLLSERE